MCINHYIRLMLDNNLSGNRPVHRRQQSVVSWHRPWSHCQMYREVDKEWDVQRAPKGTASSFALTGLVLGLTVDKWWIYANGRSSCVPAAARLARLVTATPAIASPWCEDAQQNRPRKICAGSLGGPDPRKEHSNWLQTFSLPLFI